MSRLTHVALTLVAAAALAACASKRNPNTPDDEPTIASIAGRKAEVVADAGVKTSEEQAMAAYNRFLETAPKGKDAPQRAQAQRRLGDLEMDLTDSRIADGKGGLTASGAPDYQAAIKRYQNYLQTYPKDPNNDRVLYQLSRAQEQSGDLSGALKTLDRLVAEYPSTVHREEAQFRRGELLFTAKDYGRAEKAYATVLAQPQRDTFKERSLYMQGWSVFKQGRLDEALKSFFGVLDLTVANIPESELGDGSIEAIPGLSRGDRELVEDTFRVTSLSLANLQGAESIPAYIDSDARRSYEFRVYQQLGELYVKQERVKDAADTYAAFARKHPLHAQAPVLQTRVIEIYEKNGFGNLALDAKRDYVSRYGIDSEFRRANPAGWERAQPLVKMHLAELARHHHSLAQKNKTSGDYQEAVRWYRLYLKSFPTDADAPANHFLLAELLREDNRFAEAAVEYEKTAYDYPAHAKSADAGYAALLSYAGQEKKTSGSEQQKVQRESVESAQRFAAAFPGDARTGSVLTNAAEKLYAIGDGKQAAVLAQQVLNPATKADASQRRVANTVLAHTAFERGDYAEAEKSYADVLALVPAGDAKRNELVERQAAAIYKQGEKARADGDAKAAVGHFNRVAAVAPQSTVRANAQYDAAAAMIGMKDWSGAAKSLEDFRARYPKHPLADEVSGKLAVAYLEQERWGQAAAEFEKLAELDPNKRRDPKLAREALWQSGGLHEKQAKANPSTAGVSRAAAAKAYDRYLKQYPEPFENAMEARFRLATLAKEDGNATREAALMREIYNADRAAGGQRTVRTRYLGATAALAMAAPAEAEYRKVQLVEPLARQLKLKKTKMEEVLKAYAVAADYGVADVVTATTHQTALLYQDFGRAMLKSERPRKLNKAELEQYNLLLEEQADPFLEKAVGLHEVNAKRASRGVYDEWVKKSFKALAELRPVRYGKSERVEGAIDAIR